MSTGPTNTGPWTQASRSLISASREVPPATRSQVHPRAVSALSMPISGFQPYGSNSGNVPPSMVNPNGDPVSVSITAGGGASVPSIIATASV